ncbi:MAG: hypothetical protein HDP34_03665 [Clostridia bacterium]|nr:hypothetical protein [Clostridia bacterium]
MKKKLIASLLVGAVLSTSIIGFTACGGDISMNKGKKVSEAEWKAAFAATISAESCTVNTYMEDINEITDIDDEAGEVHMTVTSKDKVKYCCDVKNGILYTESYLTKSRVGVPDGEETTGYEESFNEAYRVNEGTVGYSASYERGYWYVCEYSDGVYIWNPTSVLDNSYSVEKGGGKIALSELYGAFTYSDGVYTAKLYSDSYYLKPDYIISVAVKGGYVVGYHIESSYEEQGEGSYTHVESINQVYNFSDFNKTTVKLSKDAKKAIEDFKNKE